MLQIALLLCAPAPAELEPNLAAELRRRRAAEARDIYKFLHQSEFGPGHMIPDPSAARAYLERELAALGPAAPEEPIVEPLAGGLVRVNLRPYRDAGGSMARLLEAFVATAQAWRGEARRLDARLASARLALEASGRTGLAADLGVLAGTQAAKGHPALHHSEAYARAYRPAYRVVRPGPWIPASRSAR